MAWTAPEIVAPLRLKVDCGNSVGNQAQTGLLELALSCFRLSTLSQRVYHAAVDGYTAAQG